MAFKTGPIQLEGDVFIVDRKVVENDEVTTPPDYLGGTRIARLHEVLRYKMASEVNLGAKNGDTPGWSRITGDFIEIEATFTELTEEFMSLVTNNRSTGTTFVASSGNAYKYGHVLDADKYTSLVIRHDKAPEDYPLLYVPYALTLLTEWFVARGARHTQFARCSIVSVDVDGEDHENYENPTYEYGNVIEFPQYVAPE